jgi:hypothetical protein
MPVAVLKNARRLKLAVMVSKTAGFAGYCRAWTSAVSIHVSGPLVSLLSSMMILKGSSLSMELLVPRESSKQTTKIYRAEGNLGIEVISWIDDCLVSNHGLTLAP